MIGTFVPRSPGFVFVPALLHLHLSTLFTDDESLLGPLYPPPHTHTHTFIRICAQIHIKVRLRTHKEAAIIMKLSTQPPPFFFL